MYYLKTNINLTFLRLHKTCIVQNPSQVKGIHSFYRVHCIVKQNLVCFNIYRIHSNVVFDKESSTFMDLS